MLGVGPSGGGWGQRSQLLVFILHIMSPPQASPVHGSAAVSSFRHSRGPSPPDTLCLRFYGWHPAHKLICASRRAGFRIVGHVVFRKHYASSVRFLQGKHEQAYLLAKGDPRLPSAPISDVLDWEYTGNCNSA